MEALDLEALASLFCLFVEKKPGLYIYPVCRTGKVHPCDRVLLSFISSMAGNRGTAADKLKPNLLASITRQPLPPVHG
jgi:hypothetical protein